MTDSCIKAAISVTEMAKILGFSRNHFCHLIKRGVFPAPQRTESNRPYFSADLQRQCSEIKQTQIGANGKFVLFYQPRNSQAGNPKPKVAKVDERTKGLVDALTHLGLKVTPEQVDQAAAQVFPEGLPGDDGTVIRAIFMHLKRSNPA